MGLHLRGSACSCAKGPASARATRTPRPPLRLRARAIAPVKRGRKPHDGSPDCGGKNLVPSPPRVRTHRRATNTREPPSRRRPPTSPGGRCPRWMRRLWAGVTPMKPSASSVPSPRNALARPRPRAESRRPRSDPGERVRRPYIRCTFCSRVSHLGVWHLGRDRCTNCGQVLARESALRRLPVEPHVTEPTRTLGSSRNDEITVTLVQGGMPRLGASGRICVVRRRRVGSGCVVRACGGGRRPWAAKSASRPGLGWGGGGCLPVM